MSPISRLTLITRTFSVIFDSKANNSEDIENEVTHKIRDTELQPSASDDFEFRQDHITNSR